MKHALGIHGGSDDAWIFNNIIQSTQGSGADVSTSQSSHVIKQCFH
jgi:hypothetical protein